jgi:hypothetical protein
MKAGRSLTELAAELTRQQEAKRDFVVDSRAVTFASAPAAAPEGSLEQMARIAPAAPRKRSATEPTEPALSTIRLDGIDDTFGLTRHAAGQIAEWAGIPKPYYDR